MYAVTLSHGLRQLMWARRGMCFHCRVLPITFVFSNRLGFSDTTEMRVCRTKFGIVTLCIRTTGSVSLLVDDSFVPEDIISSVINAPLLTLILRCWCIDLKTYIHHVLENQYDINLSGFGCHILGFFFTICRFSQRGATSIWCPGLSCFVGQEGWGGSVGDACFLHCVGRRLLPDVCDYPVSRIASVDVSSKGGVLRLQSLSRHLCFSKRLGFSNTDEFKYRNARLSHLIWYRMLVFKLQASFGSH